MRYKAIAMVFATLVVVTAMKVYDKHQQNVKLYGPNPASVKFETNWGSGHMMVRDRNNAEAEVKAQLEEDWKFVCSSKSIKVQGERPPFKINKLEIQ